MSTDESATVVRAAYDYLVKVLLASGTPAGKLSNFRVEELSPDAENYNVTLSYEVEGDFAFDKKRELKDFIVTKTGVVMSMKIRKLD